MRHGAGAGRPLRAKNGPLLWGERSRRVQYVPTQIQTVWFHSIMLRSMANRGPEEYAEMSRTVEAGEYTVAGPVEMFGVRQIRPPTGSTPGWPP